MREKLKDIEDQRTKATIYHKTERERDKEREKI